MESVCPFDSNVQMKLVIPSGQQKSIVFYRSCLKIHETYIGRHSFSLFFFCKSCILPLYLEGYSADPHFFFLVLGGRDEYRGMCTGSSLLFLVVVTPAFSPFPLFFLPICRRTLTLFLFCPSRLVNVLLPSQVNGITIIFLGKKPIESIVNINFWYMNQLMLSFIILH